MTYTLRDLPLPVKVVVTVFLMAVGVGYTSAMVQLHMQDSKSGKPMPTVDDVIRKYTGKKKFDPNAPPQRPVSRLEALIMAEPPAINGQSMSGAFTTEDRAKGPLKFGNATRGQLPEVVEQIRAERKGEQIALKLWIGAPEKERKEAYDADKFVPPVGEMPKALTPALVDGNAVKVKSIIEHRCVPCHSKGGEKEDVPLDTYDGLAKFMTADAPAPTGAWVKVEEPISVTKLTQSTHAHLMSFAVLFSLTGLIFAFSSYPTGMRCVLGPWVVLAVFADVSLWWLARLCNDWGPYFAVAIIFTGMVAGAGLFGQIVLSLFNLYGPRGKIVIGALLAIGGVIAALMVVNVFEPALRAKQNAVKPAEPNKGNKDENKPKVIDKKGQEPPPKVPSSAAEDLLAFPLKGPDGKPLSLEQTPWASGPDGNMARAFFDKEKFFKEFMDDETNPPAAKDKLMAERDGERAAVVAWLRTADPARKAAYDADALPLPAELVGKPITEKYLKDGKVLVTTLIADRCLKCHGPDKKQYEDYPLDGYDKWSKYFNPWTAAPVPAPPVVPAPAPPAPKAVTPIPDAKDD